MTILISHKDINTKINHEPRVLDVKLAKALGFKVPAMIRKIIKRHLPALEKLSTISIVEIVRRGQKTTEYYLTEKQALYLCTKSQAERAVEVTIQMVEAFYEVKHGKAENLPVQQQLSLPAPSLPSKDKERIKAALNGIQEMHAVLHHLRYVTNTLSVSDRASYMERMKVQVIEALELQRITIEGALMHIR